MRKWVEVLIMCWLYLSSALALAASSIDPQLAKDLTANSSSKRVAAIEALGQSATVQATAVLRALGTGKVFISPDGAVYLEKDDGFLDVLTQQLVAQKPELAKRVKFNNRLRGVLQTELAYARLFDEDRSVRLAAARELQSNPDAQRVSILQKAQDQTEDREFKQAIATAIASASLLADSLEQRLAAINQLGDSGQGQFKVTLEKLLLKADDGRYLQPEAIRLAAQRAIEQIEWQQTLEKWLGNVFFGLSLGSVLLLAALGLAIIFGLMGVINMAHGELLMIGAYSTYLVQTAVQTWLPWAIDLYVLIAIPVAFLITACVGMVLEKTVIRWLYGRPLETLLATWGVSLILMQAVRTIFGAQNVEVANPSWMSGGWRVMGDLVISYNRIYIFFFALLVVALIWLILNRTRIGLFVRAITQNRRMANCVGVPTARVDMLAFGLGAGIAGLGGVALSQLGNVGPDLGRAYIVDSFMVVVLGGVGQLAGTVIAALGLGAINKMIEPMSGAVIAKIAILVFIILFIQKRPQGIFAPKGRSAQ
jgi:urea transport system permease protein